MMDVKSPFSSGLTEAGVTYEQAMEIHRLFLEDLLAAPTVAVRTGIPYDVVVKVLDGKHFPGAHQFWVDRVFP